MQNAFRQAIIEMILRLKILPLLLGCFFLMMCVNGQSMRHSVDLVHFPTSLKITGSGARGINSIIKKERLQTVFYISTDITSNGEQEITNIDIPLNIEEAASVLKFIRKRFHWLPNIKAQGDEIIADHVFRSPCIIQTLMHHSVVLIPDVRLMSSNYAAPYYLDLNYSSNKITFHYGIAVYKTEGHVYYLKSNKPFTAPKQLRIAFYLLYLNTTDPAIVVRKTDQFLWQHFAAKYTNDIRPQTISYERYADTGYHMALNHYWVSAGDGKGGITLSTLYNDSSKTYGGRYYPNDLWFQSWFNNMRTAYGLYSWGKQAHNDEWLEKARDVTWLLLSSPINQGWFSTIYNTQENA
jgi:hypothetical protein